MTVQSLDRAFAILRATADAGVIGVTELARRLDLSKSTVSRLLVSLESNGAVERVPGQGTYRLGEGMIALVNRVPYARQLTVLARPYLLRLAQATGETTNLVLMQGSQAYYVDQVDSRYHLQIQDWTGRYFPPHVVSVGKVFMAYWPASQLDAYLAEPLESFTPYTITRPDVMRQELAQVREQGVAWVINEWDEAITGIAVPIFADEETPTAAIGVSGPSFRFPPEDQIEAIEQQVKDAGQQLSRELQARTQSVPGT